MGVPLRTRVSLGQRIFDHLLFPVNMWLSEEASARIGLTPIDHERVRMALRYCKGRVLDVACGNNLLVRTRGEGVGVDVHPYPEIDALCRCPDLPFRDSCFETVALLASLNHLTRRDETLRECCRVLKPGGLLLITMISPVVGYFSHPIRKPHDPDQLGRGIGEEESLGLWSRTVRKHLQESGFELRTHRRFLWGLNNLYVASKRT